MSAQRPVIHWFRQDLRLADNPALRSAAATGAPVLPVYVLDDDSPGDWAMGAASRWWLHESLAALDESLGGRLALLQGPAEQEIPALAEAVQADGVFWNRGYEPWRRESDRRVRASLGELGCETGTGNASALFEPQSVMKEDGTPYKVFTPFYRKGCLENSPAPRRPQQKPRGLSLYRHRGGAGLDELDLLPEHRWHESLAGEWTPGEQGAKNRLRSFLRRGLAEYAEGRNRPDRRQVSRLSPHLHFGEISPRGVWHAVAGADAPKKAIDTFHSELGWREFSAYLLYHFPELPRDNLQRKFDRFPWRRDKKALRAWQQGDTGYPVVDAGMRELWHTGWMHNRVRMIVASLLTKNLRLHWLEGARWFWDTLVDADLANNSASWQWVAGCGADAAPYFRIFNPVTQGRKFDPDGDYVRRYVPELSGLPAIYIHCPWDAPEEMLDEAGVELGRNYPKPIVELKASRDRALAAFKSL